MSALVMPNSAQAARIDIRGRIGRTASIVRDLRSMVMPAERRMLESERALVYDWNEVPVDILAQVFSHLGSFKDMANASRVCKSWGEGMRQALASREALSFAGWRADDGAVTRLVNGAWCLRELIMWGCRITDAGLKKLSLAHCCPNLISISLWGITGITDGGVVQLMSRATSVEYLNVGGTFITDVTVVAIAKHCPRLKVLNLWGCRRVTEAGLLALSEGCPLLYSMNVWGMRISPSCELKLLGSNRQLKLKPSQIRFPFPLIN